MDGAVIEGVVKNFLLSQYDNPAPIPEFHRELWDLCCLDDRYVAIAAPRGHAKSTCVTHAYVLSRVLFGESQFVLIVSDTEGQAVEFLRDLKHELDGNDELRKTFGIKGFLKDSEADVIVDMGGWQFRIVAKGSEQKLRGLKWHGKRPDLIVGDDLENDEIVMNGDRREKFRNWVMKALLPVGSDRCLVRIVGTVLHFDSLLERLLNDKNWMSRRYKGHADYDDFSELLWPEKWPEDRLRELRAKFESQGMPEGYSQEILNMPISEASSYFRKGDFLPMTDEDRKKKKVFYALADLAMSKAARADSSAFGVIGLDDEGIIHVVDAQTDKLDSWEITEKLFQIQSDWQPEMFGIEEENIKRAIGPFIKREMLKRGVYLNFPDPPLIPTKDKMQRARSIQARMRAGGVRFDTEADWFPALQEQMLRFPRGAHDDYVDMLSWAGLLMDRLRNANTPEEDDDEERWNTQEYVGRSMICGY